jgi:outer membrane protein assembly factor BamB
LFKDLLILTMDGIDFQYLVALDKLTGKTVWKTDRTANWNDLEADGQPRGGGDFRKAYATPLIVDFQGAKQMLSVGSKAAYSYDPATGREIWKINHAGFSSASRPVFDGTNAFIATGNGKGEMLCVRVDGQGEVTEKQIVWRNGRGFPRMPSPVYAEGLLFMVSDSGIVSCLEARTGKELWQERLGGDYSASLLYADGRVYCFGQDGKATVLKAERTYEVLGSNRLAAGFMASPAILGKALILRTKTDLYRIEEMPPAAVLK